MQTTELRASVSNIDLYRVWRDDEDLDLQWILDRLLKPFEQTPAMAAGEAFHKALENAASGVTDTVQANGYHFEFNCAATVTIPKMRELNISGVYDGLLVRGRVDSVDGHIVTDYKTTRQFDADRLMEGYQWRYYLDIIGARTFCWKVFVLRELDDPMSYAVTDVHELVQHRYEAMHDDCLRLAREYREFAREYLVEKAVTA